MWKMELDQFQINRHMDSLSQISWSVPLHQLTTDPYHHVVLHHVPRSRTEHQHWSLRNGWYIYLKQMWHIVNTCFPDIRMGWEWFITVLINQVTRDDMRLTLKLVVHSQVNVINALYLIAICWAVAIIKINLQQNGTIVQSQIRWCQTNYKCK